MWFSRGEFRGNPAMSAGVCRCRVAGILHTMDRYRALVEAEVDTFVAQRTRPNRDGVVRASDLFAAYVEWSNTLSTSPVPPMTNSMFGRVASSRITRRRVSGGHLYLGVELV